MGTRYRGSAVEVRALDTYIKLMRATDTLHHRLHAPLAADGLTAGQLAVLEALLHLGRLSQVELGKKLLRSGSHVCTVLDNLEADGFIARRRGTADRRVVTVSLTAAGRRRIARVFPAHARRIAMLMGVLTAAEQRALAAICRRLGLSLRSQED